MRTTTLLLAASALARALHVHEHPEYQAIFQSPALDALSDFDNHNNEPGFLLDLDELRLVQFAPETEPVYMTERQKLQAKRLGMKYMDITDRPASFNTREKKHFEYPPPNSTLVKKILPLLSLDEVKANLEQFTAFRTRYYNSVTGKNSSEWLAERVKEYVTELATAEVKGMVEVELFEHRWLQASVDDPITVIGAHCDSINHANPFLPAPGADDDGSGTVTILEALRALLESGYVPKSPLEFHFYSAEEGGLLGSQAVVAAYEQAGKQIKGMLHFDMTAWHVEGTEEVVNMLTNDVDPDLTKFLTQVAERYVEVPFVTEKLIPGAGSDHMSWTRSGYQSCCATEALMAHSNFKNIHTANDNINVSRDFSIEHTQQVCRRAHFVSHVVDLPTLSPTMDDVFTDAPAIVDFDVLEASKENVQPLPSGRRAAALSAALSTPHAQRESRLAATRNRLRINVELALEDDDDDPLEAYWHLVNWTLDSYPQGQSNESGLLELLEEATRVLKDHREGRWRGEMKYLKLWLLYASFVEKPSVIYAFLVANDIGTDWALLYEENAAVLDRDGRRKEADAAYQLGIARKATPLEHLKARYADFQKRMMLPSAVPASAPPPAPSAVDVAAPRRPALATTSAVTPLATSATGARAQRSQPQASSSASNARFAVFEDPMAESADAGGNAWPDLGTRKTRIKENVPATKQMTGSTLRQPGRSRRAASAAAGGASSSIVPYVDTEEDLMPPPPPPVTKKTKSTSVPRTPAKTSSSGFQPFVDAPETGVPPATPKFVPFQDEVDAAPVMSTPVPESVMKVKTSAAGSGGSGSGGGGAISEAEALRRDPLKNYT
ncbi:BUB1 N-terminal domain-containing protein [Mycena kentingensis (nom. inval.)]|nr:BUB1 N-terminal domain-containing protein [Mycena kentingensis (nom. inval.)]